jgi:TonB family protein
VAPPAAAASPPPVDAPPPQLSHAAIERVASAHRRELSSCDGGEELHGEVTVRFWVDAAGKVVNAQLSSSLNRPRVAACILHQVQSWVINGHPAGAQGTYTLSFQ